MRVFLTRGLALHSLIEPGDELDLIVGEGEACRLDVATIAGLHDVAALAHTYEDPIALVERPRDCQLMFVDLGLDGKPAGIEVARRAAGKGLGVVVMTGGSTVPDELAGAGLLLKPFSMEQVQRLVHTLRPR